jgi:hypothetical protein
LRETHGATSGYVVGYDLDGILKQKDIITGSVSLIGAAVAGGSLSSALLIGNQTGITPIISSTSSYILSGSGVKNRFKCVQLHQVHLQVIHI